MDILENYIPKNAKSLVKNIITKHPFCLKIVAERSSKYGDFKKIKNGFQITVNHNLNPYQFLLTLIHEIAHLVTYKKHKRVKPHGIEWKQNFQHLMLPFLHPNIFPSTLLPHLANYLKNPKASSNSDTKLTYAIKQYDKKSEKNFIFELEEGTNFIFRNKKYKKGKKRRTRFECLQLESSKIYLFNANAEIKKLT